MEARKQKRSSTDTKSSSTLTLKDMLSNANITK
jgi:hypothetical protein